MISTDGKRTAAHRPTHGGYPDATPAPATTLGRYEKKTLTLLSPEAAALIAQLVRSDIPVEDIFAKRETWREAQAAFPKS